MKQIRHAAFTLIELLIVVAIIAILAAIAVPNFLEAQTRAKVSRAQADLRTVATALESYAIDYNNYPTMLEPGFNHFLPQLNDLKWWYVPNALSTPVAYLSNADMRGPFGGNLERKDDFPDELWRRYGYENIVELRRESDTRPVLQNRYARDGVLAWSGAWRLNCVGPDQLWNPSQTYDPTNGTISPGDIIRTQASTVGNTNPDTLNSGSN